MKKTEQEKLFAVKNFHGPSIKCFNVITLDYAFEHVLTLTLSHCSNSVLTPDPKHCSHKICCINTNNTCLNTCHYSKIGVLTLTREPWISSDVIGVGVGVIAVAVGGGGGGGNDGGGGGGDANGTMGES